MRSFLYILCCLLGFLTVAVEGMAQDQVFSQFWASPLRLNPALTGASEAPLIALNYRNQWPSWPRAYASYSASYDQYFYKASSGFGLQLFSDNAGDGIYITNKVAATYAYVLPIRDDLFLKGGLEAAFGQKSLNWDKLIFMDQIDPISGAFNELGLPNSTEEEKPDVLSRNYIDFSAGLLLYSSRFYGGATVKHINSPNENFLNEGSDFGQAPIFYSIHGGAEIDLSRANNKKQKPAFISPNILLARQSDFTQLNLGAYASVSQFLGGIWYRHTFSNVDAVIFLVGLRKGILKISYSYDLTISDLAPDSGGAHEVSLLFNLSESEKNRKKRSKGQYNNCLKMFK